MALAADRSGLGSTSNAGEVDQTGTYTSGLTVGTDSPYAVPAIAATMKVTGQH